MKTLLLLAAVGFGVSATAAQAQVSLVDYDSLGGTQFVTFEDIASGSGAGASYDGIVFSNGVGFAERFVGQTLTDVGGFDRLGGAPSGGALALQVGAPGQNLNIFENGGTNVLTGLGSLGFPAAEAIGEGSFAALFGAGQSQFGFQLVRGNGGAANVSFFGNDGSLIQSLALTNLADGYYGFQRDGGFNDIYGISIDNDDTNGIGFDNLKFDVRSVGGAVPEPATWLMMIAGFGLVGAAMRRRQKAAVRFA